MTLKITDNQYGDYGRLSQQQLGFLFTNEALAIKCVCVSLMLIVGYAMHKSCAIHFSRFHSGAAHGRKRCRDSTSIHRRKLTKGL